MLQYSDIPLAHVLNYLLADAFEASGETDVFAWLGDGKTLHEMYGLGTVVEFYTPKRRDEIADHLYYLGLDDLEANLNSSGEPIAIVLTFKQHFELIFRAGSREGTPWFITEFFQEERRRVLARH